MAAHGFETRLTNEMLRCLAISADTAMGKGHPYHDANFLDKWFKK